MLWLAKPKGLATICWDSEMGLGLNPKGPGREKPLPAGLPRRWPSRCGLPLL